MHAAEMYFLLFTDGITANLAINTSSEFVIFSMKIFHSYNPYIVIIVSTMSFTMATLINYTFGKICYKILSPLAAGRNDKPGNNIVYFQNSKYLFLFLILSGIPFFGKFVSLFAGFMRTNLASTVITSFFTKLLYYSYFMLN